jgi:DnaK suppressor protein
MMKPEEIKKLQDLLFDEKTKLMNKAQEFKSLHLKNHESGQDEAEISSNDINMNLAIELQERDRLALIRIEKALQKIENGSYGVCESCGADVGLKRLFIQPLARLCIDCMMEQEAESRMTH